MNARGIEFRVSSPAARKVVEAGEAIVLGVSPFNGFYRPSTVESLVDWSAERFRHVYVLLAGPEAAQRFVSRGLPPRRAVNKVKTAVHQQRRAACRALLAAGCSDPNAYALVWSRLAVSPRYRELRAAAAHAYDTVPSVRDTVRSMVSEAVAPTPGALPPPEAIEANAPYVLAETPILVDAPRILGHEYAVFAYHKPMPLHELLATGVVPELTPRPGQACARLTLREL
ncbi:tRNA-dependent cyclodipeptide synthase [Streptomyces sp. NPDC047967]|uniref:tRNA-dependent cyclodipeptide synthase n=1 Tax=Streptomyces sp. NPDC047967 TaxID=3154924 RepID=UPI0033DCBC16